ncbi:Hpt domain-containing protein [Frigidibacter sp. ROC022]|uniref:Hpt domain-containing protein n=1 Tax=Frigidibacter sp. ROC022 TaxID=2971796 RepID=UPI00215ACA8E|nr:Hpt domain-containing protein [Frigidibacter sp. ROC022]MCR8726148.1 Hpt domain-containing protein [Frigidibacter sp. ROC022]
MDALARNDDPTLPVRSPHAMAVHSPELAGLEKVRARFLESHYDHHDRLEILLERVSRGEDVATHLSEAKGMLHRIAGTAGMLGYGRLGTEAREVEYLLDTELANAVEQPDRAILAIDRFLDTSMAVCVPDP